MPISPLGQRADSWDRKLWGVMFTGSLPLDQPMLIGKVWHKFAPTLYEGEPTAPLLFRTRATARAWCDAVHKKYVERNDCCADWRFRPVRVRETVRPL